MQVDFTPKGNFLKTRKDTAVKDWAKIVQSDPFQEVLTVAVAQFIKERNPEAIQIRAVKEFIDVLMDLPFEPKPMPRMPVKSLDHTAYDTLAVNSLKQ